MHLNVGISPGDFPPNGIIFNKTDSVQDCDTPSFWNRTSNASPTVADCQQITQNIAGGGTWYVLGIAGQRQLVQYGTCAFGVTVFIPRGVLLTKIGNQDIINRINTSIDKFASNGLVGAEGLMECEDILSADGYRDDPVDWGIYHT
ncbi:putative necrosis-inducing factor-domain-containing protein [Diplogelasinospora grovesii]|uniref:Necrosis-inducing factor-domain-containing protein n=1 Tax=Diplogelasinospora grovesii TaxID=303347 RepID=A0AAN6N3Y1_9PEZI|nr:putative necrosis-inducing factor-domain-containing protein [Diplogelasinospora grovesii]